MGGRVASAGDAARPEDPRRHAGHPARHGRDRGSHARELRDLQASDPGRRAGALRRRGPVPAGRAPGRTTAAAAVPARDARSDRGEPARDRDRAARPRLGTVRGLRPRQRAREPRRGGRQPRIRTSARTTRSTCRRWPRCPRCRTPSSSRTICWSRCGSARSRPGSSSCRRSSRTGCATRVRHGSRGATILERIDNYLRSDPGKQLLISSQF